MICSHDYFFKRFVLGAAFVAGGAVCPVGGVAGAEFDCGGWKLETLFAGGTD
jgi:hypothetical protein